MDGRAVPTRKDIFVEVDWMEGHEMSYIAKRKVTTRFLNNPTGEEIWLHIDDGLMGGGEDVGFEERVETAEWAIDNGYFDHQGQKFHYCLMAHYPVDQPEWYEFWEGDPLGVANAPGDELCLFDENLVSVKDQAHVFLHELTHNLMGQYDSTRDYFGHNPDADHLIDTDDNDPWGEHCPHDNCALQTGLPSWEREGITNLCDDCWNSIKLRYSF